MITIDDVAGTVRIHNGNEDMDRVLSMSDPAAFEIVSRYWLRATWDAKYVYSFTWLGRPIIQLPDDLIRMQELVFEVKPDLIIETGVAHGGSLVFYASLLSVLGNGRVIGIDVDIRSSNRKAIEEHILADRIELIEGSSIDEKTLELVRSSVGEEDTVLVVLDSNHEKRHVLRELELYGSFVTPGSYIVATDGIKEMVVGGPRTDATWVWDNPRQAAHEFVAQNEDFELVEMSPRLFNEGATQNWVTYFQDGLIRRRRKL